MPLTYCRVCASPGLSPLWVDYGGYQWHHCSRCGSDSSEAPYRLDLYGKQFLDKALGDVGGIERARAVLRNNIEWFERFRTVGNNDFLDVGCLEGAAMDVAAELGWSVHGWDIDESSAKPGCTTITPHFAAAAFPQLYHAVHCREVIEHVPGWRGFLTEITAVMYRGGLLQIQTPRPCSEPNKIPYQPAHLQIFSPAALERAVKTHGFEVLDRWEWEAGQAWMFCLVDSNNS